MSIVQFFKFILSNMIHDIKTVFSNHFLVNKFYISINQYDNFLYISYFSFILFFLFIYLFLFFFYSFFLLLISKLSFFPCVFLRRVSIDIRHIICIQKFNASLHYANFFHRISEIFAQLKSSLCEDALTTYLYLVHVAFFLYLIM